MALPKFRTSKARTKTRRRVTEKRELASGSICPDCGEMKLPHKICPSCGMYKGKTVIRKG